MNRVALSLEELERWEAAGNMLGEAALGVALIDPVAPFNLFGNEPTLSRSPERETSQATASSGRPPEPSELGLSVSAVEPNRAANTSTQNEAGTGTLPFGQEVGDSDLAVGLVDQFWRAFTPEALTDPLPVETTPATPEQNRSSDDVSQTASFGRSTTPNTGSSAPGPVASAKTQGETQPVRFERLQPASGTSSTPITFGGFETQSSSTLPEVTIEAIDPTASESGESSGAFRISRDSEIGSPLVVYYEVGGTADEDDYSETLVDPNTGIGSVTIPAGEYSVALNVTPIADQTLESWEYVQVDLTHLNSGGGDYTIGDPSYDYVDIADESYDGIASGGGSGSSGGTIVYIGAVDPNASEFAVSTAAYKVNREGGSLSSALDVEVYVGGLAMVGEDYSGLADYWQTVTIPAGESSVTLKITPVDDTGLTGDGSEMNEPVRMLLPGVDPSAGYTPADGYFVNLDIRDAKPDHRIQPGSFPTKLKTQVQGGGPLVVYRVDAYQNGSASVVNSHESKVNNDNNPGHIAGGGADPKQNFVSMDLTFTQEGMIDTTFEALPTGGTSEFRFEMFLVNDTDAFQNNVIFELGFLINGTFVSAAGTGLDFDSPHQDPFPQDGNLRFRHGSFAYVNDAKLHWSGTQIPDQGHGIPSQPNPAATAGMFFQVDVPDWNSAMDNLGVQQTAVGGYEFTLRTSLTQP